MEHAARGLCVNCYRTEMERRHNAPRKVGTKRRLILQTHTVSKLEFDYVHQKMSLGDLALKYGCTRQYIHKLLKQFGVKRRDRATAREVALDKNKIIWHRENHDGSTSNITLDKIHINQKFFKSWSPAMAYVLGFIFTDGNLLPSSSKDPQYQNNPMSRFSIVQKEPEILHKILALMECDAKLYVTKQPLYKIQITNEEMYDDLLQFGLKPNKSLSIEFPNIPEPYVRHFIRGCWDGDGSVYCEGNSPNYPCASFVSGSRLFVEGILKQLIILGLPRNIIHSAKNRKSFYFRYRGPDCAALYHVLYDEVPESMYLNRKQNLFKAIADRFEGSSVIRNTLPFHNPVFVFPESLTRTTIARLLGIRPYQVTARSQLIRTELQNLSDKPDQDTIDKLKQEATRILRHNE